MLSSKKLTQFLPRFLRNWLEHPTLGVDLYPLFLASFVGVVTGLASVLFIYLIEIITEEATVWRDEWGIPASLAILVLAGVITGVMIRFLSHEVEGGADRAYGHYSLQAGFYRIQDRRRVARPAQPSVP